MILHFKPQTQELAWLIETGSPAKYVSESHWHFDRTFVLTDDPWKAMRFLTEDEAWEAIKKSYAAAESYRVAQHCFISP